MQDEQTKINHFYILKTVNQIFFKVPFISTPKKMKCWGLNIRKCVKVFKMKEIKDLNACRDKQYLWFGKLNIVKMSISLNVSLSLTKFLLIS